MVRREDFSPSSCPTPHSFLNGTERGLRGSGDEWGWSSSALSPFLHSSGSTCRPYSPCLSFSSTITTCITYYFPHSFFQQIPIESLPSAALCSLNQRSCKETSCPQGESVHVHAGLLQLCPTLCDPPGAPIYGVLQVWMLERVPCVLHQGIFLTQESDPRLLCLLHWQECSLPSGPSEKPPLERDGQ